MGQYQCGSCAGCQVGRRLAGLRAALCRQEPRSPVETVIFDWDGTLARSLHLWIDSNHAAFGRRGQSNSHDQIVAAFFHEHHLVAEQHPHLDFGLIAQECRVHLFASAGAVALHAGALAVLDLLHQRGLGFGQFKPACRAGARLGGA